MPVGLPLAFGRVGEAIRARRHHLCHAIAEPISNVLQRRLQIDDLEPRLTRNGYDMKSLVDQFDAKPAEIRRLLRGDLDPGRTRELLEEMRAVGLPT